MPPVSQVGCQAPVRTSGGFAAVGHPGAGDRGGLTVHPGPPQPAVHPHGRASGSRPDLYQVAQPVRQPQRAAAGVVLALRPPADQRILFAPGVVDLADQRGTLLPHLQHLATSGAAHTGLGDAAHRGGKPARAPGVEARALGPPTHPIRDLMSVAAGDHPIAHRADRSGQLPSEHRADVVRAAVGGAAAIAAHIHDRRVAAMRLGDHRRIERFRVVGAQQPQRRVRGDGQVQQGFVELALLQFRRSATHPHRLADTANRYRALLGAAAVPVDEVAPSRNDAGRVATDLAHVQEFDPLGVGAEGVAKGLNASRDDGDHDRLIPIDALADERQHRVQEALLTAIHQCLVPITAVSLTHSDAQRRRHSPPINSPPPRSPDQAHTIRHCAAPGWAAQLVVLPSQYCGHAPVCAGLVRFLNPQPRHPCPVGRPRPGCPTPGVHPQQVMTRCAHDRDHGLQDRTDDKDRSGTAQEEHVMGLLHRSHRHDDEPAVQRYQMREKLLAIGDDYWIENESGREGLQGQRQGGPVPADVHPGGPDGNELAKIQERKLSVRDKMNIECGGTSATVHKAMLGIRDRYTIDPDNGENLHAHGNFVDHEYEIERDGDTIATISKKWFRVRDTYGVEIGAGEDQAFILAVTVCVDEMARG